MSVKPFNHRRRFVAFALFLGLCVSESKAFCPSSPSTAVNTRTTTATSTCRMLSEEVAHPVTAKFPFSERPFLAVITEPGGCDSDDRLENTMRVLDQATCLDNVDLISVRIARQERNPDQEHRVEKLIRYLVERSVGNKYRVVVSSDWIETGLVAGAHGVHFKESHRALISTIHRDGLLIGTSAHSVESALDAYERCRPDYFFVGTCYLTASHPEKTCSKDLEGPSLPGQVREALTRIADGNAPVVFAIGGIDSSNCRQPVVEFGADGVAVIRAVLAASDPSLASRDICEKMH